MKFYVIEIATGDKKIEGKGIYEYESKEKALANYHKKLGIAMDSELYKTDLVMAIAGNGDVYATESFVNDKYAPQAEEVVTE